MKYLNQFFALRCCGDVLNAAAPISSGAKEITEAMGMRKLVKSVALKNNNVVHIDLCSGNCLTSLLSAFTFPNVYAFGVDLRAPREAFAHVRRFMYFQGDIHQLEIAQSGAHNGAFHEPEKMRIGVSASEIVVLTAMHACGNLSKYIIDMFVDSPAKHLILCPCCIGKGEGWFYNVALNCLHMGRHEAWCWYLAGMLHDAGIDDCYIIKDANVLSPRNLFIVANKGS